MGEHYEVFIYFQLMGGPVHLHFLETVWVLLSVILKSAEGNGCNKQNEVLLFIPCEYMTVLLPLPISIIQVSLFGGKANKTTVDVCNETHTQRYTVPVPLQKNKLKTSFWHGVSAM